MNAYARVQHRDYDYHCKASGHMIWQQEFGHNGTQVVVPAFFLDLHCYEYEAIWHLIIIAFNGSSPISVM